MSKCTRKINSQKSEALITHSVQRNNWPGKAGKALGKVFFSLSPFFLQWTFKDAATLRNNFSKISQEAQPDKTRNAASVATQSSTSKTNFSWLRVLRKWESSADRGRGRGKGGGERRQTVRQHAGRPNWLWRCLTSTSIFECRRHQSLLRPPPR